MLRRRAISSRSAGQSASIGSEGEAANGGTLAVVRTGRVLVLLLLGLAILSTACAPPEANTSPKEPPPTAPSTTTLPPTTVPARRPTTTSAPTTTTTTAPSAAREPFIAVTVPRPGSTVPAGLVEFAGTARPGALVWHERANALADEDGRWSLAALVTTTGTQAFTVNAETGPVTAFIRLDVDGEPDELVLSEPVDGVPRVPWEPHGVYAIGDSIMVSGDDAHCGTLAAAVPGIEINARGGRQFRHGESVLRSLLARGRVPEVLIVHLGTNGATSRRTFDAFMVAAAPVPRVLFVNIRIPRDYETAVNAILRSGARRYPNVDLVDWWGASEERPDFLSTDGFHVNCAGARVIARLIARRL